MSPRSEILILGAGVIGVSLAVELASRGHAVSVLDRGRPLAQASTAAAGMLAAEDPTNPLELLSFARFSASIYPAFLARIAALSQRSVPFQTDSTLQLMGDGTVRRLTEHSLDPRQLAPALLDAANNAGVQIITDPGPLQNLQTLQERAEALVFTTGAWAAGALPVSPRKGQMLRVRLPDNKPMTEVIRGAHTYIVPRTQGPQAGTALVGATVEDAGFNTTTSPADLSALRRTATRLLPGLADESRYPLVEAWAGLRPATPDDLPILGPLPTTAQDPRPLRFVATGHFRNGILLAPGTALLMAHLIEGHTPQIDLTPFSPARFEETTGSDSLFGHV